MIITGQHFGKLTALHFTERRKGNDYWLCRCECGNELECSYANLVTGRGIKSCWQCKKNRYIGTVCGDYTIVGPGRLGECLVCGDQKVILLAEMGQNVTCLYCERNWTYMGKTYGKALVLYPALAGHNSLNDRWVFRCTCGTESMTALKNLLYGFSESCRECGYARRKAEGVK